MKKRNVIGSRIKDAHSIDNEQYNEAAGAQKQIDVGPKLTGIPTVVAGALTQTTNATTKLGLPSAGRSIAVYNNANAVGSITFGDVNVTSQAPGAVDGTGTYVGIPCAPNAWTYLSAGYATYVIASAATLLCFLIEDNTSIVDQK